MKFFHAFLIAVLYAVFVAPSFAGVGSVDNREYVTKDVWKRDYPDIVNLISYLKMGGVQYRNCTAEYIAPHLILTAAHCVMKDDGTLDAGKKIAITATGLTCAVDFLFSLDWRGEFQKDWAVVKVVDNNSECYRPSGVQRSVLPKEYTQYSMYNLGFGGLTILSNNELTKLKQAIDKCPSCGDGHSSAYDPEEIEKIAQQVIGRSLDDDKLKIHKPCSGKKQSDGNIIADCDVWQGNSGGPFFNGQGELVGVMSGEAGTYGFTDEDFSGGPSMHLLEPYIKDLLEKYPVQPEVVAQNVVQKTEQDASQTTNNDNNIIHADGSEQNITTIASLASIANSEHDIVSSIVASPGVAPENSKKVDIAIQDYIRNQIQRERNKLNAAGSVSTMSLARFRNTVLKPVVQINKLQKAYDEAKENEQSLANRMLGGATMAATGIGGMELAMGLAQQKADKAADADMEAYISTFQCKVADKRYKGGESGIELGGANQLTQMHQEYVNLAASLKERKAALGMKPGLEANVILDKATMELYDNVGNGIEEGHFVSRYRASKGNEKDAKALQEEKDAAKKRVIAGGVIAGAGVVGGIVGNAIINRDKQNNNDTPDSNESADGEHDYEISSDNGDGETVQPRELTGRVAQLRSDASETKQPSAAGASTVGCGFGKDIITSHGGCTAKYSSEPDLTRCTNCISHAGTYENGKCYIEVIGWACLAKGWDAAVKNPNPAPCSADNKYADCHIIRKYVDAEKPFVCDPNELMPGKTAVLSGCGQHGWSAGDKHPPMNIGSADAKPQDCKLPLANNVDWRKMYRKGSAIGISYNGKNVVTTNWCMPNQKASPWNSSNHTGAAKHLNASSLMAGGESKDKWFSLD